ncbi:MAG: hypothetical protein H8K06_17315 [Nitrospira sp.]|uniref:hypothetical protein n=1 Tax=Nitrospira defluvii TaxID=330214 RepID=UPI001BB47E95|nr:hypothetical protein [Nitrospira defluvii]MCS6328828.1 hypothetical protein [Nitrospira sp.]
MVEIIGLGTMIALVWLIAWSMAGESESEKRRMISALRDNTATTSHQRTRHAA